MIKCCFSVVCVLLFNCLNSQTIKKDSAQILKSVLIKSLRENSLNGATFIQNLGATELLGRQGNSMAEVLQENTSVFIRNYGAGGLATASFRGSNAYHTPVIWNGINIQNPMNGQIDFSGIPVFFSDEISLQHGGNGGIWGSGAMAGVLVINNANHAEEKLKLEALASAVHYGMFQTGIKLSFQQKNWFSSSKIFSNFGNNNFKYSHLGNTFVQENASTNEKGFQQAIGYQKNKNKVGGLVWYNESNKQIAPNLAASNNQATQNDKNLRLALTHNYSGKKGTSELKLAYFYDELVYSDNNIGTSWSRSHTTNFSAEKNLQLNTNNGLHFGMTNWFAAANVDGYEKPVSQNRLAAFVFYTLKSKNNHFKQQVGLRKELVNNSFVPFIPSYFLQYQINPSLLVKYNLATSYRLPTFNDLYWKNGGNIHLKPEQGWCSDIALAYKNKFRHLTSEITGLIFYREINNYVQWIPVQSAVFSPINIGNVRAFGQEFIAKLSFQQSKNFLLSTSYIGSFVNSVDSKTNFQLIFTPRVKHVFNLLLGHKNFILKYNHTYTGVSYTKSDLSAWNDDFEIGNLTLSQQVVFKKLNAIHFQIGINNIWNKSYFVMPDRPMPLRNYQISIHYSITKT